MYELSASQDGQPAHSHLSGGFPNELLNWGPGGRFGSTSFFNVPGHFPNPISDAQRRAVYSHFISDIIAEGKTESAFLRTFYAWIEASQEGQTRHSGEREFDHSIRVRWITGNAGWQVGDENWRHVDADVIALGHDGPENHLLSFLAGPQVSMEERSQMHAHLYRVLLEKGWEEYFAQRDQMVSSALLDFGCSEVATQGIVDRTKAKPLKDDEIPPTVTGLLGDEELRKLAGLLSHSIRKDDVEPFRSINIAKWQQMGPETIAAWLADIHDNLDHIDHHPNPLKQLLEMRNVYLAHIRMNSSHKTPVGLYLLTRVEESLARVWDERGHNVK